MLETGKILQVRYRVEKQIGQGGMGSVYLATDKRFNSTVAIKETLFTDDKFRKAFSREARLLNSLKHTALPKVSDTFIESNGQYIVMEYIAGDDLFEMLEKSGEAFPKEDVLIWAEQLLDALEYLHGQSNPVIHRDIKPQNLKLTSSGQIILLDFGLAKGNPTDANHQTAANSIFGYSRNYASLEQIQGTGTDPRSDIYSLAATLYHLLTGKPPADALTRVMMVLNEEKDPLQKANLIHEQVSEELADHLQEAMSLNANLRPQSATEMRELLSGKRKTTVTTKPNSASNKAAGTNLYTQNTKVFAEGEQSASDSKQSDIKTAVLPVGGVAGDSIKTVIGNPINTYGNRLNTNNNEVKASRFSSKKLFMAAGLGVLFLIGTFASALYLSEQGSGLDNFTSDEDPKLIDNAAIIDSNLDLNAEIANTNTTDENTNSNLTAETFDETQQAEKDKRKNSASKKSQLAIDDTSFTPTELPPPPIRNRSGETVTMSDGGIFMPNPSGDGGVILVPNPNVSNDTVILVPKASPINKKTEKEPVEKNKKPKTDEPKKPVEKPRIETRERRLRDRRRPPPPKDGRRPFPKRPLPRP